MILSSITLNYIQLGALAIASIFIIWKQFSTGSSKISSDTIEAYKGQVEIYEKRLASNALEMNSMSGKIGELKGALDARDVQIAEMRLTIENRNPKLEGVLEKLMGFMESVDNRLKKLDGHLINQDGIMKKMRAHQKEPVVITTKTKVNKK